MVSLQIAPGRAVHGRVPLGKPKVKADIHLEEEAENCPAKEQFAVINEVKRIYKRADSSEPSSLLDPRFLPILPPARVRKAPSIFRTVKPKDGRWRWESSYSKR